MTPKEKAEYLIDSFIRDGYDLVMSEQQAKRYALIAVDEIINSAPFFAYDDDGNFYRSIVDAKKYWEYVKQEIEKL